MADSDTVIDHCPIPLAVSGFGRRAAHGFWARGQAQMKAATYIMASLIGLAVVPALFMSMDHDVVVRWSNQVLDLVSR